MDSVTVERDESDADETDKVVGGSCANVCGGKNWTIFFRQFKSWNQIGLKIFGGLLASFTAMTSFRNTCGRKVWKFSEEHIP